MIIAGLVLKLRCALTDDEIIELLKLDDKIDRYKRHLSFDDLCSDDFNGLGIIHFSGLSTLVIHRNIGYTCSFEGKDMYAQDLRIQSLSNLGEILCFLSNPYSATFGYAYFKNGHRLANQAIAGGELLEGTICLDLGDVKLTEEGVFSLIEKIGDFNLVDLITIPKSEILVFNQL